MATLEDAMELKAKCIYYGLSGTEMFDTMTDEELAKNYNGIGPEWFPEKLREAIDNLCDLLQPIAFIHDNRWATSDGTRTMFYSTNAELKENGDKIVKEEYGWYNPYRYVLLHRVNLFKKLCDQFGWSAYKAAYDAKEVQA